MKGLFSGCSNLISLPDISKWKTNNVNDLSELFYGCTSLKSLPIFLIGIHLKLLI